MPDGFDFAGWYQYGPTPGELGPAVVVGHVDSTQGIAIFWRLRELLPGDEIYIDRQDGTTATLKVDDIQQYSQDQFPTDKVYGNIDHAGLRLITCGGTFSTVTHHYSDNTVVYASLE
jgi:sortase (surface protein transpeptidase)